VGDTFGGAEERYRGEEGSEFVLRFRIQDAPKLDLWVQIPGLLWGQQGLSSGSFVNSQRRTGFLGSKLTAIS
jgi:hypothetical protein